MNKEKYLISDNVYDNFVFIHKNKGLVECIPPNWEGKTVEDALMYMEMVIRG